MLFNSLDYLLFFPVVVLLTFLIPAKVRYLWLLAASYYFYMSWNAVYGLLILTCTLTTWLCARILAYLNTSAYDDKKKASTKKVVLTLGLMINFGLLFYFKYTNFALETIQKICAGFGIALNVPAFDILLPVGISFFTFQAVGYTIDVYRGNIEPEQNLFRYALFVAFFPQLVAGPIERAGNLLRQLCDVHTFDVRRVKDGMLTIAWGVFLKIVIADRCAMVVNPIYNAPADHDGLEIIVATVLFALQIYCDFNGYTKIAIGSARVLGYTLMENFDTPYFARSVKEFWRRWHISLTSWFTDYLYIPLGGNRTGIIRKHINTLFVFLCSGLWHGAAWHFVVWGGLNGLFVIIEDSLFRCLARIGKTLKIDTGKASFLAFRHICTFIAVNTAWMFFRANSLREGIMMLGKVFRDFRYQWFLNLDVVSMFDNPKTPALLAAAMMILFLADLFHYRSIDVKNLILRQQVVFRWIIYIVFLLIILFWGVYGQDYEQSEFIYFQF